MRPILFCFSSGITEGNNASSAMSAFEAGEFLLWPLPAPADVLGASVCLCRSPV